MPATACAPLEDIAAAIKTPFVMLLCVQVAPKSVV